MEPNWKFSQLDYWNQRAVAGKGTGIVPFRNLELLFVDFWKKGNLILDAGCGLGEIMLHLRQTDKSLTLLGFDFSPEMVQQARHHGLNVFLADIVNIKLNDKSVDTTIAIRTIKNLLDLHTQSLAIGELSRITSKRVIVIDSIKETLVVPPSYNKYLPHDWLINNFKQKGFHLVHEEYFKLNLLGFPLFASSQNFIPGSDEGFFVFDRDNKRRCELFTWKLQEIKYSFLTMIRSLLRKINSIIHYVSRT